MGIGTLLFVRSRFTLTLVVTAMTVVVLVRFAIMFVAEISLSDAGPVRFLSMLELGPFVVLLVSLLCVAPRFGGWERLAGVRYRRHATAAAGCCLWLPQIVLLASVPALPADTEWRWISSNLLILSATAVLVTSVVTSTSAVLVMTGLFVAMLLAQNVLGPVVPWLPLASGRDPQQRWWLGTVLAVLALGCYYRRTGARALDSSLRHNEE